MMVVTLLFLLQNVMSICSWSLDDVCDPDDIKCQNPPFSNPGEIIYGQCYRHAALRRLLKIVPERPFAANAELNEPFGLSKDLGHGMMYKCPNKIQMYGKPFAVCRKTGIWKSMFICGEGSLLSRFKKTGQSTCFNCAVYETGEGVDGIKDPRNFFHTDSELEPFWSVDLGHVYKVQKVVSTNRIDCCGK
ncbi:unnamed protein product [Mytilus edulis]|uniref:Sushi domain-containing protein n=1 Tax=Mytilus edulis TaxID=6550 RepID=A0A8S3VGB0_MYTED|nr:unnamed protein product [Mytilus edulis]